MRISEEAKRDIIRRIQYKHDMWKYDFCERLKRDSKYFKLRDELAECVDLWQNALNPIGLKIVYDKYFTTIDIVEIC